MATALPPASDWTGSSVTEGQFKTAQTNLRAYLAGLFGTDGNTATAIATMGTLCSYPAYVTTSYSVTLADRGRFFIFNGSSITVSLPSISAVETGFTIAIRNLGAQPITIDPYLSELIEGAATLSVVQGGFLFVSNFGNQWLVMGMPAGANGAYRTMQVYAAAGSYTWTKPAGLARIKVTVVGGGGGGNGSGTNLSGGGAGGIAIRTLAESSVTGTVTVTVGGAGSGATSGTAGSGGTSSFGAYVSATGGGGGVATAGVLGTPGTGSGGDINVSGNAGSCCPSAAGQNAIGGPGYIGQYGAGGRANPGSGGAGAGGIVIVEEFY